LLLSPSLRKAICSAPELTVRVTAGFCSAPNRRAGLIANGTAARCAAIVLTPAAAFCAAANREIGGICSAPELAIRACAAFCPATGHRAGLAANGPAVRPAAIIPTPAAGFCAAANREIGGIRSASQLAVHPAAGIGFTPSRRAGLTANGNAARPATTVLTPAAGFCAAANREIGGICSAPELAVRASAGFCSAPNRRAGLIPNGTAARPAAIVLTPAAGLCAAAHRKIKGICSAPELAVRASAGFCSASNNRRAGLIANGTAARPAAIVLTLAAGLCAAP